MNENKDIKTVVRTFFAWQEEKEEKWLREMSGKGWHLLGVGFLNYRFERGKPSDMVYKFDFKVLRKSEMNDYIMTFKDAGWEYIGNFGSWFYFRTSADGDHSLELYNDNKSMIEKYKRLLLVLGVVSFPMMFFSLPNLYMRIIDMAEDSVLRDSHIFNIYLPFVIILTIFAAIAVYAIIRILLIIQNLKKDIRQ
jgi:hypothetical protein